jgi:predicted nicotinamide N-methyase
LLMAAAAALLATADASAESIEKSLADVLQDGAFLEFSKNFGPRRLMKLLSRGALTDRAAELADELLTRSNHGGVGLTSELDFSEVVHRDELHPDELVPLAAASQVPPLDDGAECLPLHLQVGVAFVPTACQLRFDGPCDCEPGATTQEPPPTLRLHQLSRRARLGSEIECKIWPAAAMLGRWLWRHRRLVRGRTILELGAGVGTAGLAAAAGGARRVVLTDINSAALRCARENCARNGERVRASACVGRLDWARPPILETGDGASGDGGEDGSGSGQAEARACGMSEVDGAPSDAEVASMLLQRFDVILAADVINNSGLSELVYRMIRLHLAPRGVFIMVCPKARHRFQIEELRRLLVDSSELATEVAEAPPWLTDGLGDEAQIVEHELIVAQWADPATYTRCGTE